MSEFDFLKRETCERCGISTNKGLWKSSTEPDKWVCGNCRIAEDKELEKVFEVSIFAVPHCDSLLRDSDVAIGKTYTCGCCGIEIKIVKDKRERVQFT